MRARPDPAQRGAIPPLLAFLAFAAGFAGCASAPTVRPGGPSVFYPSLPDPPRIQYLLSVSSPEDIGIRRGGSGFERFVTGKEPGEAAGALQKPYGVALHGGKLYVVDTRGPGYAIFDLPGKRYKFVPGEGAGRMRKPINIRVDRDGTRYVTDTERGQVLVYDDQDRFLRAFGTAGRFRPGDVEVGGDRLYVSDLENHRIEILDKKTGETLQAFGQAGSRNGEFFFPTNLSLGSDHFLYVTDTGNFRVQKFTFFGKKVGSMGTVGTSPGQFARPKGIALDRRNRLYVVDAAFENVQIFDPGGTLLLFFGGPGTGPGSLNLPASVYVDYDSAPYFQQYADPRFRLEYVIAVTNQFGLGKVVLFGFGRMEGMSYPEDPPPSRKSGGTPRALK